MGGSWSSLAASIALPLGGGMLIGMSLRNETTGPWYKGLKKPSWNPPSWVFGPVWTAIYSMMGVAAWRVWQAGAGPVPLGLYAAQLALNFAWSPIMFKKHDLKLAAVDITALLGLVVATAYEFGKIDQTAGLLFVPYLAWGTFATCLTYNLLANNSEEGKRAKEAAKEAASSAAAKAEAASAKVHAAASEASAQAATPFLAQGGERQQSSVPTEAAEATAARREGGGKED